MILFWFILNYLWIFITLVLLIWVWIWIFNQVFSQIEKDVKWKFLLWGALLVWILFLYDFSFDFLWIDREYFYLREVFNFPSVSLFITFWIAVLILITLIFKNIKNKSLLSEVGVALLAFVVLSLFWWWFWFTVLVLYYLLAAFTEEIFKFTVSNNQSENIQSKKISFLLFLSVLIWLSFSISENIFSFFNQIVSWNLTVWFILGRGVIASLIHCVSTWLIALVLINLKKWWLFLRYFIALLLWSFVHIVYNLAVVNNITWLVFLLVILCLVCLSYLFFNMDEIYNK